jgi:HTH-type transcriptional regulator, sugar sensing transcriptional regulator
LRVLTRGVSCRLLIEAGPLDEGHRSRLVDYAAAGVEIRFHEKLPLKLALFDNRCGLVALLDPVLTKPSWTSVIFDHTGFAEGMSGLFENYWALGSKHQPASLEANAG